MGIASMRVLAFLALAVVVTGHWTHDDSLAYEIGPPEGETMPEGHVENPLMLASMEEGETSDETVYRITFGTAMMSEEAAAANSPWSKSQFTADIKGESLNTGAKVMASYAPTLKYSDASGTPGSFAAKLHPGMETPGCPINTNECEKEIQTPADSANGILYVGKPGLIQHAQITSTKKIGEIKQVTIAEKVGEAPDGWMPSFIKINANDPKTGLGAGVYYIDPQNKEILGDSNPLTAAVKKADGTLPEKAVELKRCLAQFCEEEMDQRMGLELVKSS